MFSRHLTKISCTRIAKPSNHSIFKNVRGFGVENSSQFQNYTPSEKIEWHLMKNQFSEAVDEINANVRKNNVPEGILMFNNLLKQLHISDTTPEASKTIASKCVDSLKQQNIPPDASFYLNLISLYAKQGDMATAQKYFEEMKQNNLKITANVYNVLIKGFALQGDTSNMTKYYQEMINAKEVPTAINYGNMIYAYGHKGDLSQIQECIKSMSQNKVTPSLHVYNGLFEIYGRRYDVDSLTKVFDEMVSNGIKPTVLHYNTLIHTFCNRGDVQTAYKYYDSMYRYGIRPDIVTYKYLMEGFAKIGDVNNIADLYETSIKEGIVADRGIYGALIGAYGQVGDIATMVTYFEKMIADGHTPDVSTFNRIIDAYGRTGDSLSMIQMFNRCFEFRIVPTLATYQSIIYWLGKTGDTRIMLKYFQGISDPDMITYTIVLENLLRNSEIELAAQYLRQMRSLWKRFNLNVYNTMIILYGKLKDVEQVSEIVHEMREAGIPKSEMIFKSIINAYLDCGDLSLALRMYDKMKHKFVPDQKLLQRLIHAAGSHKRANTVRSLWEDVVQTFKYTPTEELYNTKLEALLNCGNFEEAMAVFNMSIQRKLLRSTRMVDDFLRMLARIETNESMQHKILELARGLETRDNLSSAQLNEIANLLYNLRVSHYEEFK